MSGHECVANARLFFGGIVMQTFDGFWWTDYSSMDFRCSVTFKEINWYLTFCNGDLTNRKKKKEKKRDITRE